jgi:hypothetical protein
MLFAIELLAGVQQRRLDYSAFEQGGESVLRNY